VDHVTLYRWVQRLPPELIAAALSGSRTRPRRLISGFRLLVRIR
jgi:hypothetical protein